MNYKTILWTLVLICIAAGVQAHITDNVMVWYDGTNVSTTLVDTAEYKNATTEGGPAFHEDATGKYIDCDGGNDFIAVPYDTMTNETLRAGLTIGLWYNGRMGTASKMWGIDDWGDPSQASTSMKLYFDSTSGLELKFIDNDGQTIDWNALKPTNYNDGAWHSVVVKLITLKKAPELWFDGVNQSLAGNDAGTLDNIAAFDTDDVFLFCGLHDADDNSRDSPIKTNLTNIVIWNTTDVDAADFHSRGRGYSPFGNTSTTNFTITAEVNHWGDTLTVFNATVNGIYYNTTGGTITTSILSNHSSLINVTVRAAGHDNREYLNYNASTNMVAVLNRTYFELNITANHGGALVTTFTVNATSSVDSFQLNTSTGWVVMNVSKYRNYTLVLDATGYAFGNDTINLSAWSSTYNFTLYSTNGFIIEFLDEVTHARLNWTTISAEFIGDLAAYNYTTTTGILNASLMEPQEYLIRFESNDDHAKRGYYIVLANRTAHNLTLYLLSKNHTDYLEVTATVYDETNHPIEGAFIKVLRYNIATNAYFITEIARTNFEGIATLNVLENVNEYYKFIIEYPLGTVKKETESTYIYASTMNFQILLGDETAADFYHSQNISYSLTYNTGTNNFRLLWTDGLNTMTQACINVTTQGLQGETLINSTCGSGATGIIYSGISPVNGSTYHAGVIAYFGTDPYYLGSLAQAFDETNPIGTLGLFMVLFLTIAFIFVGYWNLAVAIILTPLPLMFSSLARIISIPVYITVPLELIAVIIAYAISKKA